MDLKTWLFAVLGLAVVSLWLLEVQVTGSYTFQVDLGMKELNNRKAAFMEAGQEAMLKAMTAPPAPTEEIAPPTEGFRYYP